MRSASLCALSITGLLLAATACSGDDTPETFVVATTEMESSDTSPIFSEVTVASGGVVTSTDAEPTETSASATTIASGPATTIPSNVPTTIETGPATTVNDGGSPTTVANAGASTTVASTSGTDFVVVTGTANIDGVDEKTVDVRARSGASGDVVVPVRGILNIVLPGPNDWDLDPVPDDLVMDVIDVDDVPDGADDPFPEAGGATIITLRPLVTGSTTLTVIDFAQAAQGDPITVRVTVV